MTLKPNQRRSLQGRIVAGVLALATPFALGACNNSADTQYASDWGPSIGSEAPLLAASDQNGDAQTLASLTGSAGLLVVFNRSVVW
ncbi:MAG: hypothetical protein AAFX03_09105 [Pseudomonadota bacterium]